MLFLLTFSASAQEEKKDNKATVWKKEKDLFDYQKDKNYKGPLNWNTDSPSSIKKEAGEDFEDFKYDPQEIRRNRERREYSYDDGNGLDEPEIERPIQEQESRQHEPIRVDDRPKVKTPLLSDSFLKTLGYIFLFVLVIFVIYSLIKNRDGFKKESSGDVVIKDMNPATISKTELELLLEKYISEENYRECIRVYFTFILKEIIKNGWIKWKKEKTNFDYILEMKSKPDAASFEECVRIYDLVWYGEYEITKEVYESLQPTLLSYYQSLQKPTQNR